MKTQILKSIFLFNLLSFIFFYNSNAQVVYTDISDTTISVSGSVYQLDLNNDGVKDFNIELNITQASTHTRTICACTGIRYNTYLKITPLGSNEAGNDVNSGLTAVSLNTIIKSSAFTWKNDSDQLFRSQEYHCSWNAGGSGCSYRFFSTGLTSGYLPLRIHVGTSTFYGWLQYAVGGTAITIKDYAFKNSNGSLILAGQTTTAYISTPVINDTTLCSGNNASVSYVKYGTFNSSNIFTVQLSDATGSFANPVSIGSISSAASGNINVTIPSNTLNGNNYHVRVTSSSPVRTSIVNQKSLIVNNLLPSDVITSTNQPPFCAGIGISLSAVTGSGLSYQWMHDNSAFGAAIGYSIFPTQAGGYKCVITNACGTVISNTFTVLPQPDAIITSPAVNFCQGGSILFSANTGAGLSYSWYKNSTIINGANNTSYNATTAGNYKVVVTDNSGCTKVSNAIDITKSTALPTGTITSIGSFPSCAGSAYLLAGDPANIYVWKNNGVIIPNNPYYPSHCYPPTSGSYTCQITNGCGTSVSNPVSVTVLASPDAIINTTETIAICASSTVTLSCNTAPGLSYQWQNGSDISGATSSSYVADSTGNFRVKQTNSNGCIKYSGYAHIIKGKPPVSITAAGSSFCAGDSAALYASSYGSTFTYQWKRNNSNISGATARTYYAKQAGTYKVKVTTSYGNCDSVSAGFVVSVICRESSEPIYEPGESRKGIIIYPNPATNAVIIKFPSDERGEIQIANLFGQIVFSEKINAEQAQIDVSKFSAGMYLVSWRSGENNETKIFSVIK